MQSAKNMLTIILCTFRGVVEFVVGKTLVLALPAYGVTRSRGGDGDCKDGCGGCNC